LVAINAVRYLKLKVITIQKPENQNVYISNMRDNYVLIYDGSD